ncbi:MAG: alkaline phosphatase family protein [Acidobacteria bacterium]|nr:alkaline phosphatase family protein [Acidobacteriota bacterium]
MEIARSVKFCLATIIFVGSTALAYAAPKVHVLIISVDGMRPDYITEADRHGLKIPTLRKFYAESTYAEGVIGVIPTITYPSHTTIMTGVWPIEHGIFGNQKFTPLREGKEQITEFSDIRVKTLWEAAHEAGYTVASVGWPVTTGSRFIDWLLPANAAFEGSDPDGGSVEADPNKHYDNPPGLREQLASELPAGKLSIDATRHAWELAIIRRYKPDFITTHVGDLDHAEHRHGPFSPEANAAMETADAEIAETIAAERANYPDAYIFVVSDHGFLPTDHSLYINGLLKREGLIDPASGTWDAAAYTTGASAAIIVRDPGNTKITEKVISVIMAAAKDPSYGIARVLTHNEVVARGGIPSALLMLDPAPGWRFAMGTKAVTAEAPRTGAHGQLPDHKELRSSFFLVGPKIHRRNLGVIDMRQIAPTVAQILGVKLPAAQSPALPF